MIEIIEELKENQILHGKSVTALRNYITQKYPHDSSDIITKIFADAVNKIIDNNIIHFDQTNRAQIKKDLFKQIAKKEIFTINAYEVFEACLHLDLQNDYPLECLTKWMNNNQSTKISTDKVRQLTFDLRVEVTPSEVSFVEINAVPRVSLPRIQLPEIPTIPIQSEASLLHNIGDLYLGISKELLHWFNRHSIKVIVSMLILVGLFVFIKGPFLEKSDQKPDEVTAYTLSTPTSDAAYSSVIETTTENSQNSLEYQEINVETLKHWLSEKNSLLAEDLYFNSIISAAKEFDVHPLLLFAITGQEQAFVPDSSKHAALIANNPFNVYGSWEDYNTTIGEASRIAAKTIVNLRKNCPENSDVIQWINRKYAEDPNWHIGVSKIFSQLKEVTK